jgi:enoyl-CoA hydratase/carnithine racemase
MNDVEFTVENGVAEITVHREEKKNAMASALREETLAPLVRECRDDDDVRVLVFRTGGDDVFSTGGDLQELLDEDFDAEAIKRIGESWEELHFQLQNLGKPTIAVVDGLALAGAANLLLYMDIVVASTTARIGWAGVRRGIVEWFSATRLQHYIGPRRAMYYLLTGDLIDADDAAEMGLVTMAVPPAELEQTVAGVTETLRNNDPETLARMREAVYRSLEMSPASAFEVTKREVYERNSDDPALQEGIRAFLEDRDPEWRP